jgi:hypothetical protein
MLEAEQKFREAIRKREKERWEFVLYRHPDSRWGWYWGWYIRTEDYYNNSGSARFKYPERAWLDFAKAVVKWMHERRHLEKG